MEERDGIVGRSPCRDVVVPLVIETPAEREGGRERECVTERGGGVEREGGRERGREPGQGMPRASRRTEPAS